MANNTLMTNLSSGIADTFKSAIGVDPSQQAGAMIFVGIIILLFFILWIYKSKVGLWGIIVIIPPLFIVLSRDDYGLGMIPAWVGAVVWIIAGAIWGLILQRFFREA